MGMAVMERFCCCTVRTACLIFGILYLVGALWQIGKDCKTIIEYVLTDESKKQQEYNGIIISGEQMANFFTIDFYITIASLVLDFIMVVVASLGLKGAHKAKPKFLTPSLVFLPIDGLVRIIFVAIQASSLGFTHPLIITMHAICVISIVLDFFTWLCFYSHRQQIQGQLIDHEEFGGNEKFAM